MRGSVLQLHALVALAVLTLATANESPAEEVIRLKVADSLPPSHFVAINGIKYFMQEVEAATKGRLTFDYYPSEQLGKTKDLLSLTQNAVTDIGMISSAYQSEKLPLSAVFELPGTFSSSCEGSMAFWKMGQYDGFLGKNEFSRNNVRMLFAYVNPPYALFLGKKNLQSLKQIEGLKIRSGGGAQDIMLRMLGASPVRTTAVEVYESLARGTVDGIVFPPPTAVVYNLQAETKSVTEAENFGSIPVAFVINESHWRKIPEDLRKIIVEVGERTTRHLCKLTDEDVARSYQKFREANLEIVHLNAEDNAKLKSIFSSVKVDWINALEQRGKPAKAAIQAFDEAISESKALENN